LGTGVTVNDEELRQYVEGLARVGDRVMRPGVSAMQGQTGTVKKSAHGDYLVVEWDTTFDEPGKMTTSVTHGTRRIMDVLRAYRTMNVLQAYHMNMKDS
jgi:hypothetical protein